MNTLCTIKEFEQAITDALYLTANNHRLTEGVRGKIKVSGMPSADAIKKVERRIKRRSK
jgi:hypothetical protein